MNGSLDPDDGWAELARELGIPHQHPAEPDAEPHEIMHFAPQDEEEPQAFDGNDEEGEEQEGFEENEETESVEDATVESATAADGDEPRKKRKRRRRRRKAGVESTTEQNEAAEGEDQNDDEPEEAEVIDSGDPETVSASATRELIDKWDVPSWETIVTTLLHRPQR